MEKMKILGPAGGMLLVALLLTGCSAGFHIGESATPTTTQAMVAQSAGPEPQAVEPQPAE